MNQTVEISALTLDKEHLELYFDYQMKGRLSYQKRNSRLKIKHERIPLEEYYRFSYLQNTSKGLLMTYYFKGLIYAKISMDQGETWKPVNSGRPILNTQDGSLKHIWNFAFTEGQNGDLHALVECATDADQRDVGLCYGQVPFHLETLNFDKTMSRSPVIRGAGNPYMEFIPQRSEILAIYGAVNRKDPMFENSWHLRASMGMAKKWRESSSFKIGKRRKAIADPHLVELKNAIYLFASYDQYFIMVMKRPITVLEFIGQYF
jgi:hypothetical protein